MKWWKFEDIYIKGKWNGPSYLETDKSGKIIRITKTAPEGKFETVNGFALPGFKNAHSHAFQYLMAGLTEYLPKGRENDDFWSWRKLMYDFANKVNPDQLESIATMAYSEMLRMGFTSVAEFHYLHHDLKGTPYKYLAEMSERLLNAAKTAGINITLLPVYYQRSDFKKEALKEQRRFISQNIDKYFRLHEACEKIVKENPLFSLGVCIHSLRAVPGEDILKVFKDTNQLLPAHIHIAEQEKEVKSCLAFYKKRPVEWLLDNMDLNNRYHLVHATHMNKKETRNLAKSGANVVICPSTEGNLGDGFFNFSEYHQNHGSFSIGTDGHFNLNPLEELRLLDYGQRLKYQRRNLVCLKGGEESGEVLFNKALSAGALAMGKNHMEPFTTGSFFDAVILNPNHPILTGIKSSKILSALVFSADPSVLMGTITRGNWVIKQGQHPKYKEILKNYSKVKLELIK